MRAMMAGDTLCRGCLLGNTLYRGCLFVGTLVISLHLLSHPFLSIVYWIISGVLMLATFDGLIEFAKDRRAKISVHMNDLLDEIVPNNKALRFQTTFSRKIR